MATKLARGTGSPGCGCMYWEEKKWDVEWYFYASVYMYVLAYIWRYGSCAK